MTDRLRVVIATPLTRELVELITRDERLEVVWEPELLNDPEIDWMVGPRQRTPEDQARYEALLDSAEVLFGVPDQSGRALARTVAANPRLRWVHTIPAGGGQQVRAARLDDAALARILFTTSAGVHATPLAEFAVFGVLAGAKRLPWLQGMQRERRWGPREPLRLLAETTVLVVGLGAIGRLTAEKLSALGCRVVGVHRREVEAAVEEIVPVERFAEAAATADAIVLALPGTDATRGMLSAEVLAAVKPGITVVNVGRGTTVDEPALVEALRDGRVGLAVLDVTAVEPLPEDSPLWGMPNAVLAPHTAAISPHEPRLIAELFAENARRFLDGETLLNVVDTREFY
ncbi:D-2-hydroxyacid dehydrogenase [Protaetiibacter intestinalis]|uniref:D-2-hydroxyacid dehydrogenase n=1 Tax=Protaetiibacter intestinalis TaxID=2419774 RepID=A0A387B981_9MICO|nr:D-2-hydroxyacid dehydrogenase [Protaetiibacter intestinalis]AYF98401.1 D-2-hydroxyacid dehydrogenase [Protaetiibacter intestinalis]